MSSFLHREILVFLSYVNPDPVGLAERLIAELEIPYIAVGVDALTGSAEIRLNYLEDTRQKIDAWLASQDADYEIDVL
jgi:seryl-tRNA synthetase